MARIDWNGKNVAARVALAAQHGIEKTMSDCVRDAKTDHPGYPPASQPNTPYANRTGFETGSIRMNGAATTGLKVTGTWGAYTNYSLFLEIGTSRIGATAFDREQEAGGNMHAIRPPKFAPGQTGIGWGGFNQPPDPDRPRTGPLMAPRPYLRPAADANYRRLPYHIGAAYRSEKL